MNEPFDLAPALDGTRHVIDGENGRISYYASAPAETARHERPMLFVHSVNAAASAYEVKPLYDHYARERPVFALDLPGYGFSTRRAIRYEPRVMTDAVHAVVDAIVAAGHDLPIDAVALSLSCEFLGRAADERARAFATLGFISPTGFAEGAERRGAPETTRGIPWLYRGVTASQGLGRGLFAGLTSRPSIRYFLQKTWGSPDIDEGMFEYAHASAHQPGARHAPFSFLSGYLFSNDISDVYDRLSLPIWMAHGSRGDFIDYRRKVDYGDKPNWAIRGYETGALPHFEILDTLTADYDAFRADAAL
ncbi:alpha/beta fold hydrolase [Salinisphaera sp. Q1T1-3]|uniref:alpha/beta hydrolase n=1 Tax=Salinisphaera sp. Q1T1-3 TaxID=2321229 RepID=UPI000E74DF97|nr:alpha/beta fold hydrolase [Salinisphaera sp. Q1T1-3]RJS92089.1 alpha/beta hydrolase [Salinisphaera sp. Q1T1-3]